MTARSFFKKLFTWLAVLIVPVVLTAAIALLRLQFVEELGSRAPYTFFIFGVILTSQLLGLTAGLWTTLLSTVVATYLFQSGLTQSALLYWEEGLYTFSEAELIRAILFIAEGFTISFFSYLLISARERAARREGELKLIADHLPALIAYVDRNETYRFANRAFFDWFGLDPASLIGKNSREFLTDDGYRLVADYIRRALLGERVDYETTLELKTGKTLHVRGTYIPDRDPQGVVRGYFALVADFTEKWRSEATAKRAQQDFRSVLEHAPLLFWSIDRHGMFARLEGSGIDKLGLEPSQLLGRHYVEVFAKDPGIADDITRALAGETFASESNFRGRAYATQHVPSLDDHGHVDGVFGISTDVTDGIKERKRHESELRESRQRLNLALDSARLGAWHWNIETDEFTATALYAETLGVPTIGTDLFEIIDSHVLPEDRDAVKDQLARALATEGGVYQHEYRIRRGDGQVRWVRARGRATFDENHRPRTLAGLLIDTTDEKRIEERLIRAKDEAERASHMKSAFLANMSHEIRTPLGAMLGFAGFLKDPKLTESERDRFVDILTRNGEQLAHLIDDILDFSKVAAGQFSFEVMPSRPRQVIDDVVSLLEIKAHEKGLVLDAHVDDTVPEIIGTDPTRLKQVLVNLIGNAIKFTQRGSIRLRARGTESLTGPDHVCFEINDTGIGISEAAHAQLFQAFTQADESMTRKFGGTGLGLALSKRIAQGLGGDVTLESSVEGKGSTFLVTIADQTVAHPSPSARPRQTAPVVTDDEAALAGRRILLVEDSPDNQILIQRMLTKRGADVDTAENGQIGIEKARAGHYDLVFMDIQMPVKDGYTATEELRAEGFKTPIVALTAHAMEDARAKTLEVGCTDVLTKPVRADELVAIVQKLTAPKKKSRANTRPPDASL